MKLVFLGPPGAGKGTQAQMVCRELGLAHISTGDLLRGNIKAGTPLGVEAKTFMDRGDLVPDRLVLSMLRDRIAQEDCRQGFLLDGFPRNIPQAEALAEMVALDAAVNVAVPDDHLLRRMTGRRTCAVCGKGTHIDWLAGDACDACGGELIIRPDDNPETVANRLQVYHRQTAPLIEYYDSQGILHTVNGSQEVETVFEEIMRVLRLL